MIWYLVLGYLAASYLWGVYILARLYLGRRLRTLLVGGGRTDRKAHRLRLTGAPMPRIRVHPDLPQSEAA